MTFVDIYSIDVWANVLTAPIAYLIGAVAFIAYARRRSVMALLFSIAFFLLVIPSLNLFLWYFYDYGLVDWVVAGAVTVTAFLLLTLAYIVQIGRHSVRLSRLQSWVVLLSFGLALAYTVYLSLPFLPYYGFGALVQNALYYIPIGLIAIVVTLMVSLHRERDNRITLVGMFGFILMLAPCATIGSLLVMGMLGYVRAASDGWMDPALDVVNLLGCVVFLTAMLRMHAVKH